MVLGIYGAGGLGREVLELATIINELENRWDSFIFIDDGDVSATINDINVFKYTEAVAEYTDELEVALGVGEPDIRGKLFGKLVCDGINIPTLIHPDVHIPKTTSIGKGVVIQSGCFISCNAIIEDYVYIQPHANIGHDDILHEGCIISGFSNLGGNVSVGKYSYLGLGVNVKQGITIGDYSIVGMASAVHRDIPDEMIAMGNPARPMQRNEEHHVFK